MRTDPVDLAGVFAVPPLARKAQATRAIDFSENQLIVNHIVQAGITRLIYGGNAFLYHVTLGEFEQLLDWLTTLSAQVWAIPSIGPDYGRALDQALVLRRCSFPAVMVLPCGDPRDASGLEVGYREISANANTPLIVYLKDETNFGPEREAGLDAVARMVDDGLCVGIKYAVVREHPSHDPYLEALLARVDRRFVISGIGERPALVHMRDWKLPGFTTGSGCLAPRLSRMLFEACLASDFEEAAQLRAAFLGLEDLRDLWGPAKVLHEAATLAGIARTGAIPPFVSALTEEQRQELEPVVEQLMNFEIYGRSQTS